SSPRDGWLPSATAPRRPPTPPPGRSLPTRRRARTRRSGRPGRPARRCASPSSGPSPPPPREAAAMTALKAHEVEQFVARPDIAEGVFLVYGPDAGLVREVGHRLCRRFAGDDANAMNLVTLESAEVDAEPGRLLVEARTTSLFG